MGHVEHPQIPSDEQNANNAPQNEPKTKVKSLDRKSKQAQPKEPNDRIEGPRNPSDKEKANIVPSNKPNPKMKSVGRKRKQDQRKKPNVYVDQPSISSRRENSTPEDQPEPKTKVFVRKGKQMQPERAKSKDNKTSKLNRKVKSPKQVDAQIDVLRPKNFNPSLGLSEYLKDKILSKGTPMCLQNFMMMTLVGQSPSISDIIVRFLEWLPRTMLNGGKREPSLSSQLLVSRIHDGSASDLLVRDRLVFRACGSNAIPMVG